MIADRSDPWFDQNNVNKKKTTQPHMQNAARLVHDA